MARRVVLENFLGFFAEKGYRAVAVSLRGHGGSAAPKRFRFCTLTDYIDDVESVVARLPVPPVLVGHSMGGFIVQKLWSATTRPRRCWWRRCRSTGAAVSHSA